MPIFDASNADQEFWFVRRNFGNDDLLNFGSEISGSATEYVWLNASGTHRVSMSGTFSYDTNGDVSGTVTSITIDLGDDNDNDISITGIPSVDVTLLISTHESFWETLFTGSDTFIAPTNALSVITGDFYGDSAPGIGANDTFIVNLAGSTTSLFGDHGPFPLGNPTQAGGDDQFNVSGGGTTSTAILNGDASSVDSGETYVGGNDTFDLTLVTGPVDTLIAYGDTRFLGGTLTGGNDTFNGGSAGFLAMGDAFIVGQAVAGEYGILNGGADLMNGSSEADQLYGDVGTFQHGSVTGGIDTISGGDGDDEIAGDVHQLNGSSSSVFVGANDILNGDGGNDTIWGDFYEYRSGASITNITFGDDVIHGGAGNDAIYGDFERPGQGYDPDNNTGEDMLFGEAGNDELHGNGGNDHLDGGDDNDTLYGGAGDDRIIGGDGTDTVYIDADFRDVLYSIDMDGNFVFTDTVGDAGTDTISGVEVYYLRLFSQFWQFNIVLGDDMIADPMTGGNGNDIFFGLGGNDVLLGNDGFDILYGGDGNDFLFGGRGPDVLDGGDGIDTASYANGVNLAVTISLLTGLGTVGNSPGNDGTFDVLRNIENLIGTTRNDVLIGDDQVNMLDGANGNDLLEGGAGGDNLIGGSGVDRASYASSDAAVQITLGASGFATGGHAQGDMFTSIEGLIGSVHDDELTGDGGNNVLEGGAGADILIGGSNSGFGDTLSYEGSLAGVTVFLETNTVSGGDADGDTVSGFENITGSDEVDFLFGDMNANRILGGDGADWIYGGEGNDYLDGQGGVDLMFGEGGNDTMYAGTGASVENYLWGGTGNDTMYGGGGDDWLRGEEDNDTLFGSAGDDVLIGGAGDDVMNGGIDTDTFYGEADNDTINGNQGGDVAFGQEGNDIINGGSEGDFLFGGTGQDTINGGTENDLMWGDMPGMGDGVEDIFVFEDNWGFDAIYDFELGIDQISMGAVTGLTQFSDLTVFDGGENVTVVFVGNAITLYGITLAELNANQADFDFSALV